MRQTPGMRSRALPAVLAVLVLMCSPGVSSAAEDQDREAEAYHTPAGKSLAGEWSMISDRVAFSGLLEVEVFLEEVDGEAAGDIVLSSAQLGFLGLVDRGISTLTVVEYDGDEGRFLLDEATIDFLREPWTARLGLMQVPFGYFPSHFISGPLTEDLGETSETAVLAGLKAGGLETALWAANGDADEAGGQDGIDDYGLGARVEAGEWLELGMSFMGDLADTDAELTAGIWEKEVPGISVFAVLGMGELELIVEYLSAARKFEPADLDEDGDGTGDRPRAFNAEIAYSLSERLEMAVRAGGSSEFAGGPERQLGVCLSYGLGQGVTLALEYIREEFDAAFAEEEERHALTTRAGMEF